MTFRLKTLATAALLSASLLPGLALAQDFRALARQDLQRMHDELQANYPAPAVGGQPAQTFSSWIDAGLADAMGRVGQVNSGDAHSYLLRYYAGGFRDSNVTATPTFEGLGPYFASSWAGIVTGWRNGEYVVTYVAPGVRNAPRVGSVVTECNAQPIEDYARAKLDRWEGNLDTEAGRVMSAPYLLWNRNNPFVGGTPTTCKFRQGRRARDHQLTPMPVDPATMEAAYRTTVYMPSATPLGIEMIDGRPWVHAHSFNDSAGWPAFFRQIEAQAGNLRGSQGFVLDMRGASGGSVYSSTARGYGMANRIWTPEFTVSRQPPAGEITYRATPGNRQWYADALGRMRADAEFAASSPEVIAETQDIVAAFDAALAARQTTFTVRGRSVSADTGAANPVQGPVVVLVDAGCSGGCLDTLDLLSRLPNVRIAGSETATSSVFIDPTQLRLPSNYADLSYGHKAWTARPRANNSAYVPAEGLTYTGNPADEQAVRTWVGTLF
jgi:hypothetical protein